jgi:hypothetical protein
MSYKKKQQWYVTCRSRHHQTNKPRTEQTHPKHHTTNPNQLGEKIETSRRHLHCHHQRCVTPKAQPAADLNGPLSSSTMGLSSSSCTNTIVDPFDPVMLQHTLSSQYQGQPLILATLRGGLASSTASCLCQGLKYLRPQ